MRLATLYPAHLPVLCSMVEALQGVRPEVLSAIEQAVPQCLNDTKLSVGNYKKVRFYAGAPGAAWAVRGQGTSMPQEQTGVPCNPGRGGVGGAVPVNLGNSVPCRVRPMFAVPACGFCV